MHTRLSLIVSAHSGKIWKFKFYPIWQYMQIRKSFLKYVRSTKNMKKKNLFPVLHALHRAILIQSALTEPCLTGNKISSVWGYKFLKWLLNLHTYCQTWEIQKNLELCVPPPKYKRHSNCTEWIHKDEWYLLQHFSTDLYEIWNMKFGFPKCALYWNVERKYREIRNSGKKFAFLCYL